jgi:MFS family permease
MHAHSFPAAQPPDPPPGMRAFMIVWLGQLASMLGTGMTRFALTVWAFETTGRATALALVGFFSFAPLILMTPIAGALVDRWNRKLVVMLSDLGAGLSTVALLLLYATGNLQIWHLYVAGAFAGIFESFQFPAFSAAISVMVSKEQYGRANSMLMLAESASGVAAPVVAGALLPWVGLGGLMTFDIASFTLAVLAVLAIRIPQPARSAEGEAGRGSLLAESVYGFRYIWQRSSLLGVQIAFFFDNLFAMIGLVLLPAMVLARTGSDSIALGTVQSAMGVGGVVGGLVMSAWGGPRQRVLGVLLGFIGAGLLGQVPLGVGRTLPVWLAGAFFMSFFIPFINGSNQALWQAKVAPDVQGRVFGARRLIAQVTVPAGMLIGGFLADHVFEPAMQSGTWLAALFAPLFGTGPGAGMGLLIAFTGLLGALIGAVGLLMPVVRDVDRIMPDHDSLPEATAAAPA